MRINKNKQNKTKNGHAKLTHMHLIYRQTIKRVLRQAQIRTYSPLPMHCPRYPPVISVRNSTQNKGQARARPVSIPVHTIIAKYSSRPEEY